MLFLKFDIDNNQALSCISLNLMQILSLHVFVNDCSEVYTKMQLTLNCLQLVGLVVRVLFAHTTTANCKIVNYIFSALLLGITLVIPSYYEHDVERRFTFNHDRVWFWRFHFPFSRRAYVCVSCCWCVWQSHSLQSAASEQVLLVTMTTRIRRFNVETMNLIREWQNDRNFDFQRQGLSNFVFWTKTNAQKKRSHVRYWLGVYYLRAHDSCKEGFIRELRCRSERLRVAGFCFVFRVSKKIVNCSLVSSSSAVRLYQRHIHTLSVVQASCKQPPPVVPQKTIYSIQQQQQQQQLAFVQ